MANALQPWLRTSARMISVLHACHLVCRYLGGEIKSAAQYGSKGEAVTGITSFITSFILYGGCQ